jgi:hypothetical protein
MSSYDQRKIFHENLKHLVKTEYEEIFRILKKYDETFTENSNGIFFDVMTIKETTFIEMKNFMDFCLENRRQETARISELAMLTTEINNLLEKTT